MEIATERYKLQTVCTHFDLACFIAEALAVLSRANSCMGVVTFLYYQANKIL